MKQLKSETGFLTAVTAKVKNMCVISIFLLCLLDTVYRFCVHVNVQSILGQALQWPLHLDHFGLFCNM
jgi:hypothetical protein